MITGIFVGITNVDHKAASYTEAIYQNDMLAPTQPPSAGIQ